MRKDNNFILNQSKRQLLLTIINAIDTRLSIRKIGRGTDNGNEMAGG